MIKWHSLTITKQEFKTLESEKSKRPKAFEKWKFQKFIYYAYSYHGHLILNQIKSKHHPSIYPSSFVQPNICYSMCKNFYNLLFNFIARVLPFVCFRFLKFGIFFYFLSMATEHRTLVYIIEKSSVCLCVCNSWRMENRWWEKTKSTKWKKNVWADI